VGGNDISPLTFRDAPNSAMTKENDQDPSIEEILASIRQIISDDDLPEGGSDNAAPAPKAAAEPPPPAHEPEPEPEEEAVQNPILDLTEEVETPDSSFADAMSAFADLEREQDSAPKAPPQAAKTAKKAIQDFEIDFRDIQDEPEEQAGSAAASGSELDDFLAEVHDDTRKQVADAVADDAALFNTPAAEATMDAFSRLAENVVMSRRPADLGAVTLEDIVKDLLRPMLRQWVNDNVPRLVEALVEKELEKLARRARDE
jgi:cell pole-organizing protein PopZ